MSAEAGGNGYSSPRYQSFSTLLNQLMAARGMNNSQLARAVWGTKKDKRGYDVAQNRDRIGHYLAGRSFPVEANLRKIAVALGHPYEDLTATKPALGPVSYTTSTTAADIWARPQHGMVSFQMTILNNDPGYAVVEMHRRVRLGTASKMLALLDADDGPEAAAAGCPASASSPPAPRRG